jgi:AraC-like DNA-binding protein
MSNILQVDTFYKNLKQPPRADSSQIGHFNIFRVEDLLLPKRKPLTYSRRSFFKISLVTGHSKIHYADKCIEVTDSVLVFTNPMVPYQWEIIGEQQSGYVCIFTEAFLNRHENINNYPVFQSAENAVIALNTADADKYNELFLRMYDELQGDYAYKYDLLRNLLMEIIHSAQKMQPVARNISKGPNASERIAALFTELLERQFPVEMAGQQIKIHTPAAFAAQLNIHVNHLNKALKEITGHNTSQLLAGRLLQEAKVLLKSTNWTIAEIAWGLGFEEPNHFSSFFKNHAGSTPNKFRQAVID